jgi:hypothetical protein
MNKKDCKKDLKVVYRKGLSNEDTGVIIAKDGSIFTNSGYVWVCRSDESILYIEPEEIEPFDTDPKFTVAEINAMLDAVLNEAGNSHKSEWYGTDRDIIEVGVESFKYLLYVNYKKQAEEKLKEQALAKLTPEEIEALGIKP